MIRHLDSPFRQWGWLAIATGLLALSISAAAGLDAATILARMQRAMWPGKDMRAIFEAKVVSQLGEHAYITGAYYRKGETPRGTLQRFIIQSPLELRGFEVSGNTVGGKPESLHVYVPAVRRVRHLQVDMRKESFLASDFNFEDLGFEDLTAGQSTLVGEVDLNGKKAYQIETVPEGDWMYKKLVRYVDTVTYLPVRTDYHCWGVGLCKVRKIERVDKIGPYDSPAVITMEDLLNEQMTRLVVQKAEFDVGLPTDLFHCHAGIDAVD